MDLRQFVFFDQADHVLFVRTDAEQAEWQVDELSLTCLFPYDPERLITRGMRIGFEDDDGNLQPFEVRKVRNYEPDETQELTCEHIVISELTDIHTVEAELTNASPSSALTTVLNNQPRTMTAKWLLGNVSATATSSGDIGMGSIWQNIRTIEQNWNVYILPRVTFNSGGITGRYLDIVPAEGVWHGLRLSLDKNADEAGVTIDDTEVKTALFGYGGTAYEINNEHTDPLDKSSTKITLVGYNWTGHPAGAEINSLQGYIVDTAATNNYGRNGQPRFGFYQNSDITDQAVLAQKTWEALQSTNKPRVTVDCMVRDLYRMGYHDEKIRLHDTALVELLPMNDVLQLEIIKLSVDLLDPTATRPTIGAYIPNIVYIQRQTAREASGGVSGKLSGRVGSSQTNTEAEWSEFIAGIDANNMLISLHAAQVDHDNNVLKAAGLDIDANGVIIYATDNVNMIGSKFQATANAITQEVTDRSNADVTLQSNITQEANRITQIVTAVGDNGEVTAASIVLAINDDNTSGVTIEADHIQITGNTGILGALQVAGVIVSDDIFTSGGLSATETIYSNAVATNSITVEGDISCQDISAEVIETTGSIDCGLNVDVAGTLTVDGDSTLSDIFADSLETTGGVSVGGTVDCTYLDVGSYDGYKVNGTSIGLGNAIKQISLTGPTNNVYTLTATQLDGDTVQIGTFSRATTLSGAWSSGAFTVTATPQGDTLTTSLTNTGHWGNPSVTPGEDENTYYYATKATIGTSATIYDTGNTTTISGLGRFNAGKTAGIAIGESHFTLASVTLQGTPHTVTPISGGGWYCRTGSSYTVQGSRVSTTLYYKDSEGDFYQYPYDVYRAGTSTVTAASGSYYRYSAGDQLTLYDGGQTYANTYYTYTG